MISIATGEMTEALREVWRDGFGDDEAYISMFFEGCFQQSKAVCYFLKGKPISVAYLLPAVFVDEEGRRQPVYYLYAAATLHSCRRKGYFGRILEWIKRNIKEKVLLVPAEASLAEYYAKNGFQIWQTERKILLPAQKPDRASHWEEIGVDEYHKKRDCQFMNQCYVRWEMPMLRYILRENEFCGGFCGKILTKEGSIYVLGRRQGNTLQVLEALGIQGEKNWADYICSLAGSRGCDEAEVCLAPIVMVNGRLSAGYFNLIMG